MVLFIQPCKDQPRKDHPTDEMVYADSCGPSKTMRDIESTNGVLLRRDSFVSVGQNNGTNEPDRYVTVVTRSEAKPPLPEDSIESKEEESKYAVVMTSVSVSRPSLPDVSRVQYQEIDIKTTHVS